MKNEERDSESKHSKAFFKKFKISDLAEGVNSHNFILKFRLSMKLGFIHHKQNSDCHGKDEYRRRSEIHHKIAEAQTNRRANHYIRWIANERCRAANVR